MQYVYAVLWFIMAFLLIFKMGKENRVFYVAGGLFFFFGVWWLIDAIAPALKIFEGLPGIIFRVMIAVVLVLACLAFYRERKNTKEKEAGIEDKK